MTPATVLHGKDIDQILHGFGLGAADRFAAIAAGTINSNYRVQCGGRRYFLRVNEGKSVDDVLWEAELVAGLSEHGVRTPVPLAHAGGKRCFEFEGKWVSLFPWVEGRHLERGGIGPDDAAAVGMALAHFHLAADKIDMPQREGIYTRSRIRERFESFVGQQAATRDVEVLLAEEFERQEAGAVEHGERRLIHGDLFRDNVLFSEVGVELLDFEQASHGSRLYDLAVCLLAWCFDEDFERTLLRSLLASYLQTTEQTGDGIEDELFSECCFAALRFTVTRITDVELPGHHTPEKDFRRYARRLRLLRESGPSLLGLS